MAGARFGNSALALLNPDASSCGGSTGYRWLVLLAPAVCLAISHVKSQSQLGANAGSGYAHRDLDAIACWV